MNSALRATSEVLALNADIVGELRTAAPTSEQYSVFRAYLDARHRNGGMADMSVLDYAMMVEDSHVETRIVEYRRRKADGGNNGRGGDLLAVALTDVLCDGLSMVYSFFEPGEDRRCLGTFMILDHIARARRMGLPYVYLGYWIEGSRKMDYKAASCRRSGWRRAAGCASTATAKAASRRTRARTDYWLKQTGLCNSASLRFGGLAMPKSGLALLLVGLLASLLGGCMHSTLAPSSAASLTPRDRQLLANPPYARATIPEAYRRHIVDSRAKSSRARSWSIPTRVISISSCREARRSATAWRLGRKRWSGPASLRLAA